MIFNIEAVFDEKENGFALERHEGRRKQRSRLIYSSQQAAMRELDRGNIEWERWEDA